MTVSRANVVIDDIALERRIGYGAMQLPGPGAWGPPADRSAAIAAWADRHQLRSDRPSNSAESSMPPAQKGR